MGKRCVVFGCGSTAEKGVSLHNFPKEPNRLRQWIQFVQRTRKWTGTPQKCQICTKHFEKEAIANYLEVEMELADKVILNDNAVPTVYPPLSTCKTDVKSSNTTGEEGPSAPSFRSAYRKREVFRVCNTSSSFKLQPYKAYFCIS